MQNFQSFFRLKYIKHVSLSFEKYFSGIKVGQCVFYWKTRHI